MATVNDAKKSTDELARIKTSSDDNKELDLEAVLSDLGDFGKFQAIIYSFTILPILLISGLGLSYIFTAGQLDYR